MDLTTGPQTCVRWFRLGLFAQGLTVRLNRIPSRSHTHLIDRAGNRKPGLGFQDIPGGLWMMLRGDVERAAFDSLPEDTEVRFATTPTAIVQDADGASVTLKNTLTGELTTQRFDLVVGADGIRSTVRQLVWGRTRTTSTGSGS